MSKAKLAQQLKMYETLKVNEMNSMVRVPGGWIFEHLVSRQLCFIPWSDPLQEVERDRIVEAQLNPVKVEKASQVVDVLSIEWIDNTGEAPADVNRVDVMLEDGRILENYRIDDLKWDLTPSDEAAIITHWRPAR